ncbi:MAG: RIP metalloprotease RseP [Pseudomonadota bacterium]
MFGFLHTILSFIAVISVIVFVHEFGHCIVAKLCGVKIEVFSLGFGKEICGRYDKSGTRWKISVLPFGGYVKMYGDSSEASTPAEEIENYSAEEKAKTFHYKPLYQKAAIVAAGPIANFILTIAIFTFFIFNNGLVSNEPIIGEIMKDTPAQAAGLQVDDRILQIDDKVIVSFKDIFYTMLTNIGTPVNLKILREGKELQLTITPKEISEKDDLGNEIKRPIIGIKSKKFKIEDVGLARAVVEATKQTYNFCALNLKAISQMIVGDRNVSENIKGPIGMAKLSGQAAEKGIDYWFGFMANISASIGLVNLFPIPVLDGGHLLYYMIEAVFRRPLAKKYQEYGMRIGMSIILMFMTFAVLNDIYRWLLTLNVK